MSENSASMRSISRPRNLKFPVTKEQLERDLFVLGLSRNQIAEKYGYNPFTVWRYIHKYGIQRDPVVARISSHKTRLLTLQKVQFTARQRSIIVGSILGDGCIRKDRHKISENAHLLCGQCARRKEYLEWKARELEPFSRPLHKDESWNTYGFRTVSYVAFNEFYDLFWENGRKTVPENIAGYLDELALAVWYMDDGHKGPSSSSISVCSFTRSECEILVAALYEVFQLGADVREQVKTGSSRTWCNLYFLRRSHEGLHKIVDPLLHPCFEYKKLGERCFRD